MRKIGLLLFRIYQWCVAAPILLVLTVVTAVVTIVGCAIGNPQYWGYYPAKWWSRAWCVLTAVRVEVHGREHVRYTDSYVFVANHQGAYDIFSLYGYLGHRFVWMMRKGLNRIPLVGPACLAAGHIEVDTHSAAGLIHTIKQAQSRLADGRSLVVFPEGRRTATGRMAPFKAGAFHLAAEFGVPIVPVTINGSFNVMPRSTFNITPGKIVITLHEPLPRDLSEAEALERARTAILSALHDAWPQQPEPVPAVK